LFELALTNSVLRKRQDETDVQIKDLRVEIENLKLKDKTL